MSARVTWLPAMTVRTTEPFHLSHRNFPFLASSGHSRPTGRRGIRVRRIAAIAATICLVPALVSYVGALAGRSDSSIGIRTVRVAARQRRARLGGPRREHLLLVDRSQQGRSTAEGDAQSVRRRCGHSDSDPAAPVPPCAAPSLPPAEHRAGDPSGAYGRGRLARDVRRRRFAPPVLITSFRPEPEYPQLVVGVAWIDHTRTSVMLYPGISEPAVTMPSRGPAEVPMMRAPASSRRSTAPSS